MMNDISYLVLLGVKFVTATQSSIAGSVNGAV